MYPEFPVADILDLTGIYATLAARWCGASL